jgi:hypothetical protein
MLRITGFLDYVCLVRNSKYKETQRFGNWACFRSQVSGKTPTQLGPLERTILDRWTTHVTEKQLYKHLTSNTYSVGSLRKN